MIVFDYSFPGANPGREGIQKIDSFTWKIFPFQEEDMPAYRFRMELRISNSDSVPQEIHLCINWKDERYLKLRDRIYLSNEREELFEPVDGKIKDGEIRFTFNVLPGTTYITLQPRYSYQRFLALVNQCDSVRWEKLCETPGGKNLYLYSYLSDPSAENILILGREHAYESAASFVAEGMVRFLEQQKVNKLSKNIFIILMVNVDGVESGLCRLDAVNGIDFSRDLRPDHPVTRAILEMMTRLRPSEVIELHSWMHRDYDGLNYLNYFQARRFMKGIKNRRGLFKPFRFNYRYFFRVSEPSGILRHARKEYGSTVYTIETPWYGRKEEDLYAIGETLLMTIANF